MSTCLILMTQPTRQRQLLTQSGCRSTMLLGSNVLRPVLVRTHQAVERLSYPRAVKGSKGLARSQIYVAMLRTKFTSPVLTRRRCLEVLLP